ncbi:signal recognition particle-docking protein FtsY [Colwellia sp. 39_35_sub15_T18]|nr:signal recognition particle-docking protein FtsY [Colwellia sp. 39_35_sub15_T18]
MVSKKKKGMFSWLGFGQDEKEKIANESVQLPAQETVEDESAADAEAIPPADTDVLASVEQVIEDDLPALEPEELEPLAPEVVEPEESLIAQAREDEPEELSPPVVEAEVPTSTAKEPEAKLGFFARLKQGLSKTRANIGGGLFDLFRGKQIDDDLFEELETHLLMADVGVETTMKIIDSLTRTANRKQLKDAEALYELLKAELKKVITGVSVPLEVTNDDGPFVILMVGVNGVGKTTTIGKLAKQFQAQGKSVLLAAGDTFRAAAVEQLQVWGERNDVPVIAQHTGADSASVIFDAISAAKARNVDVIIADTAGRLQNKAHLMEELKKVVRVMKKLDVNAPHEVMLTLDAGTGQNALSQTKLFDEAVGLTGLTVTKLDGTAKGGVVFAIADKHNIPIRYLGVGEGIDDLRPFNGDDFIDALFDK